MPHTAARSCWRRTPCRASRRTWLSSALACFWHLAREGKSLHLAGAMPACLLAACPLARPAQRAIVQQTRVWNRMEVNQQSSWQHILCRRTSHRGSNTGQAASRASISVEMPRADWLAAANVGAASGSDRLSHAALMASSLGHTQPSPASSLGLPGTPDALAHSLSPDPLLGVRLHYGCVRLRMFCQHAHASSGQHNSDLIKVPFRGI